MPKTYRKRADYRFRRASHLAAMAHGLYGTAPWAIKRGTLGRTAQPSFKPLKLQLRLSGFRSGNQRKQFIARHSPTDWRQWIAGKRIKQQQDIALRRAGISV